MEKFDEFENIKTPTHFVINDDSNLEVVSIVQYEHLYAGSDILFEGDYDSCKEYVDDQTHLMDFYFND